MSFFGLGKGDNVIDLTGEHRTPRKKISTSNSSKSSSSDMSDTDGDAMRLLGGLANAGESNNSNKNNEYEEDNYQERKKFTRRFLDITDRLEELSNQIYHLSQRMEVVEKKLRIPKGD